MDNLEAVKNVPKTDKKILKLHKQKINCNKCGKIVGKYKLKSHQESKKCRIQSNNCVSLNDPVFKPEQDEHIEVKQPEKLEKSDELVNAEEYNFNKYLNELIERRENEIKALKTIKKSNQK